MTSKKARNKVYTFYKKLLRELFLFTDITVKTEKLNNGFQPFEASQVRENWATLDSGVNLNYYLSDTNKMPVQIERCNGHIHKNKLNILFVQI
jgi:hypothetical protein